MDLIPDSIHAQIRAALHDVTDTFCDTPILYKRYVGTMDRYAEDRKELNSDYQEYNLMAFVEWETLNKNNTQETLNGSINPTIIDICEDCALSVEAINYGMPPMRIIGGCSGCGGSNRTQTAERG